MTGPGVRGRRAASLRGAGRPATSRGRRRATGRIAAGRRAGLASGRLLGHPGRLVTAPAVGLGAVGDAAVASDRIRACGRTLGRCGVGRACGRRALTGRRPLMVPPPALARACPRPRAPSPGRSGRRGRKHVRPDAASSSLGVPGAAVRAPSGAPGRPVRAPARAAGAALLRAPLRRAAAAGAPPCPLRKCRAGPGPADG